jgi:hypothetical protein
MAIEEAMKSFKQYITESSPSNNTGNILYGFDFKTGIKGGKGGKIDAHQWHGDEEMKPWQIKTADEAADRYEASLKWLETIDKRNSMTMPDLPSWQMAHAKTADRIRNGKMK